MANQTANQPSKMLLRRLASCRVVLWALYTHGPMLLENLATFGRSLARGVPKLSQELMSQLAEVLAEARDILVAADRRHRDQLARTSRFRRERDDAFKALAPHAAGLRDTFLGSYGPEVAEDVGFVLRMPTQPGAMFEHTEHLIDRLGDPQLELPAARFKDVDLDPASLADEMRPLVERLGQTLERLTEEERKTDATKVAKDEALNAYDRTFLWCARSAESLFHLADLPEVASRVRPSTRRRGITAEVEAQDFEPDSEPESEADAEATGVSETPDAGASADP